MFSQSVIEKIQSYVYFLVDPRSNEVFYVGKGKGNRVFQHAEDALVSEADSDKLGKIREIRAAGKPVQHFILRHGLKDEESLLVEASLIDFIGKGNLTNKQSGHHSDYGLKSANEIERDDVSDCKWTIASSAARTGSESPAGEHVPRLPPNEPAARI